MASALGIARFAYTPLLPAMTDHFDWSFAAAGDVASANFLGYAVGALLAPRLTQSNLVRLWVAVSFMASAATTYLGAEVHTLVGWLLLRFASGVASAFCLVMITTHLIHALAREHSERLGNIHFAGVGVGILVCMTSLTLAGEVAQQWARLGALSALFMALAWMLLARQSFALPAVAPLGSTTQSAATSKVLWRLIVGYGFFGFGYVVAATFVVAMATSIDTAGLPPDLVWWVVGLSLVPSVYLWQAIANRVGMPQALTAAYLIECVGVLLAGVSTHIAGLLIACVLLGGTFAAITALGISAARTVAQDRIAFAVSAMTVAFALGQLLGPAVAGRMADIFGDFLLASLLAAILLAAAAALVVRGPVIR
jgi:MFS family permease